MSGAEFEVVRAVAYWSRPMLIATFLRGSDDGRHHSFSVFGESVAVG